MSAATRSYLARGRTDGENRLISADEPLAGLQIACGGEVPGPLAIPELGERVIASQASRTRWAGQIEAFGDEGIVRAWVEIFPHRDGDGCSLGVADWAVAPHNDGDDREAAARQLEIDRTTAELVARLDPQQNVLAVEGLAADLMQLHETMQRGIGQRWTDFVSLPEISHQQPMHWRLLDGASVVVAGSNRNWTATLAPLGKPDAGSAGFELYLVADRPLGGGIEAASTVEEAAPRVERSIGRDLAPVLRQPIARIIANAETIRTRMAGPISDEYSAYAADIAAAGQHLLGLIEDLTDLEVVEADDFSTAPDRIDLGDVARRACGILAVRASERLIELQAPGETESQLATAEFRRVLQVLLNLIGNAIRYAPESTKVKVSLGCDGEMATVSVKDKGQGLDPAQQARVFEKFERLGRQGDGGSGLGLYISRRLARAMGGDLTVSSKPGKGATFTLSVPAAEDLREKPR